MIKFIRHTGIVLRDLDKGVIFYESLGFSVIRRNDEGTSKEYEMSVAEYIPQKINFIEVVCEY